LDILSRPPGAGNPDGKANGKPPDLVGRFCRAHNLNVDSVRQRLATLELAERERLAAAVALDARRGRREAGAFPRASTLRQPDLLALLAGLLRPHGASFTAEQVKQIQDIVRAVLAEDLPDALIATMEGIDK
jgi:hypothetical protein